ncbi:uncharacterized protein LOC132641932 isoform X3 [Lycium barbarum]|uniref:uncharacterized protein LOC132641932 isoform X3 n=1 Tax=Lycium barbarum TaxID=112863 RepID=UPI00293E5DDB|nr:uncharacterized protein LOC132641932 isoform X3 [Lycium barbarum]
MGRDLIVLHFGMKSHLVLPSRTVYIRGSCLFLGFLKQWSLDSRSNPFQEGEDDMIPRSTHDSRYFIRGRAKELHAMVMQIEALETLSSFIGEHIYDVWMIAWSHGVKMKWRGTMVTIHTKRLFFKVKPSSLNKTTKHGPYFIKEWLLLRKTLLLSLNKGLKLNGDNYETWSFKVQYVLEEQEALEAINNVMNEPEDGNTVQHRRDREAYYAWRKKDSTARITLLSTLDDDILREFKDHQRAMELWIALKNRFGTCSTARLRSLTIKFDSYKKRLEHSMKTHLRQMTNMIGELKDAGHVLTDDNKFKL